MDRLSRGFTLIELLVVIAIIGLLSSIVLASVNSARVKARDARKQADFNAISIALQLYFDKTGRMPLNYVAGTQECDTSLNPAQYQLSMQELVSAGFLASVPKSPGGAQYCYYDYGPGGNIGALMETTLESAPNTTTGIPPSCRPWAALANWCDQSSTKEYCICNTY